MKRTADCSETTIIGRCWARDGGRCQSQRWPPPWVLTSVSDLKTIFRFPLANLRHPKRSVYQVRQVLEGLGLTLATPDETQEMLAFKGANEVGF